MPLGTRVLGGGAWGGRPDRGDRGRHHLGACPGCIWLACPTPRCRRRVTGCARRSPTAATVADDAPDAGPVSGDAAEDGLGLRRGPGGRGDVGAAEEGLGGTGDHRAARRVGSRRSGASGHGRAARGAGRQTRRAGHRGGADRQPCRSQPGRRHPGVGVRTLGQLQAWLAGKARARGAGRRALRRSRSRPPISPTWSGSPTPGSPSRWRPRARII